MSASLPERWRWIDERTRADHRFLRPEDHCLYFGEYRARCGWRGGPINDLIADFKRSPARIRESAHAPSVERFKERAIRSVARARRTGFARVAVDTQLTFVPIPPSALAGRSDHCDRLLRARSLAFAGWQADIRPLLRQSAATVPDHARAGARSSFAQLLAITQLDRSQLDRPLRPVVALFDDVITSGKHLAVATYRIREILPRQAIISVCIARRVRVEPQPEA